MLACVTGGLIAPGRREGLEHEDWAWAEAAKVSRQNKAAIGFVGDGYQNSKTLRKSRGSGLGLRQISWGIS
jgi:hypothetical protein